MERNQVRINLGGQTVVLRADMAEENVHQRVLKLRDAALGSRKSISVNSSLAHVSYDCVVDSLLALYVECSNNRAGLAKDKHIAWFLNKCESFSCALFSLIILQYLFCI